MHEWQKLPEAMADEIGRSLGEYVSLFAKHRDKIRTALETAAKNGTGDAAAVAGSAAGKLAEASLDEFSPDEFQMLARAAATLLPAEPKQAAPPAPAPEPVVPFVPDDEDAVILNV